MHAWQLFMGLIVPNTLLTSPLILFNSWVVASCRNKSYWAFLNRQYWASDGMENTVCQPRENCKGDSIHQTIPIHSLLYVHWKLMAVKIQLKTKAANINFNVSILKQPISHLDKKWIQNVLQRISTATRIPVKTILILPKKKVSFGCVSSHSKTCKCSEPFKGLQDRQNNKVLTNPVTCTSHDSLSCVLLERASNTDPNQS